MSSLRAIRFGTSRVVPRPRSARQSPSRGALASGWWPGSRNDPRCGPPTPLLLARATREPQSPVWLPSRSHPVDQLPHPEHRLLACWPFGSERNIEDRWPAHSPIPSGSVDSADTRPRSPGAASTSATRRDTAFRLVLSTCWSCWSMRAYRVARSSTATGSSAVRIGTTPPDPGHEGPTAFASLLAHAASAARRALVHGDRAAGDLATRGAAAGVRRRRHAFLRQRSEQ